MKHPFSKILSLFLAILTIFFFSCKKDKPLQDYVKGDVIVGITDTTEINMVFLLINSFAEIKIIQVMDFDYFSDLPIDSLNYILKILNSKSYIDTNGFSGSAWIHALNGKLMVTSPLWYMNDQNQNDWLNTIDQLKLHDNKGSYKYLVLNVPIDMENYWIVKLIEYPIIKWAELNYIVQINH